VAKVCDIAQGRCEECLVDANCSGAEQCGDDHKCHFACRADTDCTSPDKHICDTARGKCVACVNATQCPATQPLCDGDQCVQCTSDANCTDPLHPVCHGSICVECAKDDDCSDPTRPSCKGMTCRAK
jgi:hypothetical protein